MPMPIRIPNSILWSNRKKNSLRFSNRNKSISLVPDLRTRITNQDKIWQDSARISEEMDTLSCTAELNLTMMRLRDNRLETPKSVEQLSLLITIKGEDLIFGPRLLRLFFRNPDMEIKTIRHPIKKLASSQIGTEIQNPIDIIIITDQAICGTTEQKTDSKLSINSTLDQRILIPRTTKTFHRTTMSRYPTQFSLLAIWETT